MNTTRDLKRAEQLKSREARKAAFRASPSYAALVARCGEERRLRQECEARIAAPGNKTFKDVLLTYLHLDHADGVEQVSYEYLRQDTLLGGWERNTQATMPRWMWDALPDAVTIG